MILKIGAMVYNGQQYMDRQYFSFKNREEVKRHIESRVPTLYVGSQTSTVIPFDRLSEHASLSTAIGDLSQMPASMEMVEGDCLKVEGAVNWQMAKQFVEARGRALMCSPTEELALVLSGVATCCSGERSFSFGPIREHIEQLQFIDCQGRERWLCRKRDFAGGRELGPYRRQFARYQGFKNAPFPRLEKEIDLMVGMEGQLGVVTSAILKTRPKIKSNYFALMAPRWVFQVDKHRQFLANVLPFRGQVLSCEFLDFNSQRFLPEGGIFPSSDCFVLEVLDGDEMDLFSQFLPKIPWIKEEEIVLIPDGEYKVYRSHIPRAISDTISKQNVTKKGTDIQVSHGDLETLLKWYREGTELGVDYFLFGHAGDAHYHFNLLPRAGDEKKCFNYLDQLYAQLPHLVASPFAEHGVGLLKQPYLRGFLNEVQLGQFRELKSQFDPHNQFFPQGFLNMGRAIL